MIPMGTKLRYCSVCGYPIHAKSDELTAHEVKCIEEMLERARGGDNRTEEQLRLR